MQRYQFYLFPSTHAHLSGSQHVNIQDTTQSNMAAPRRPFASVRRDERVFYESGTYNGDGIADALSAGFTEIHSYEIAKNWHYHSKARFLDDARVNLHLAPSQSMDLSNLNERAVFWLDGHYSFGDTSYHETVCPVIEELEIIKNHHIKTHTILVDDVRLYGTHEFNDITLQDVASMIKSINSAYEFTFENGHVENDILVASVPASAI